jgi:hypothetical protein
MQVLRGRRHRVAELAFSPDGRWLAAGSYRGGVHVWDTADPTAAPQCPPLPDPSLVPESLAFRTDGRLFINTYTRWSLYDPAAQTLTPLRRVQAVWVAPSPDGRRVVRVRERSPLRTWVYGADGKPAPGSAVSSAGSYFARAAFAPDGTAFATAGVRYGLPVRPELAVRAAATAKPIRTLTGVFLSTDQLAFAAEGAHLLAARDAGRAAAQDREPEPQALRGAGGPPGGAGAHRR